jgi:hypothetical protein
MYGDQPESEDDDYRDTEEVAKPRRRSGKQSVPPPLPEIPSSPLMLAALLAEDDDVPAAMPTPAPAPAAREESPTNTATAINSPPEAELAIAPPPPPPPASEQRLLPPQVLHLMEHEAICFDEPSGY